MTTRMDRLKASFDAAFSPKTLEEELQDLARARQSLTEAKEAVAGLVEEFERELYVIEARQYVERAAATVDALEEKVRSRTISQFHLDGIKKKKGANSWVRETTTLDYEDDTALEHCRQHLPKALKLNRRAFEKVARVADLDFVTIGTEYKASISRDLSHLIADVDEATAE